MEGVNNTADGSKKSCCGGGGTKMVPTTDDEKRQTIMDQYAQIAKEDRACCGKTKSRDSFALDLGYTAEDLQALPEGANMGLSCGNPTARASLQTGQVVLDLGCGGGFDVFIAAKAVGETGKAIGVDMTPEMIYKARANAVKFANRTGLRNVEFRLGEIEHLPVADSSIDVIISNCVINLSPDKAQVWHEIARVLKPGGKACVSDIVLLNPLPDCLKSSISALVGCVAGAIPVDEVLGLVQQAGLVVTSAERDSVFVHKAETSDDPLYANIMKHVPEGSRPGDYVTSLKLTATKMA
jgi:SAM-dependent methyltransferase